MEMVVCQEAASAQEFHVVLISTTCRFDSMINFSDLHLFPSHPPNLTKVDVQSVPQNASDCLMQVLQQPTLLLRLAHSEWLLDNEHDSTKQLLDKARTFGSQWIEPMTLA